MTVSKRTFLIWFFGGLAAFAITLVLHAPLIIEAVPGGILEHQSAPDANTVDRIQAAWMIAGVYTQAHWAMITDLIFIGIYGMGCVLGGLYYRKSPRPVLRVLGWIALISGVIFLLTDFGETIAQFIQLSQQQGSDMLAKFASSLGLTKMTTWTASFLAILSALILDRFSSSAA